MMPHNYSTSRNRLCYKEHRNPTLWALKTQLCPILASETFVRYICTSWSFATLRTRKLAIQKTMSRSVAAGPPGKYKYSQPWMRNRSYTNSPEQKGSYFTQQPTSLPIAPGNSEGLPPCYVIGGTKNGIREYYQTMQAMQCNHSPL